MNAIWILCKKCMKRMHFSWTEKLVVYVTGPAKINHVSAKNCRFFLSLLYHNLQTVYTNTVKSLSLLQNLIGFILKFTEMGYHIQS